MKRNIEEMVAKYDELFSHGPGQIYVSDRDHDWHEVRSEIERIQTEVEEITVNIEMILYCMSLASGMKDKVDTLTPFTIQQSLNAVNGHLQRIGEGLLQVVEKL